MVIRTCANSSMRTDNTHKFSFLFAGVLCLLLLFCYRIWNLGITHHDDASWFLASQQGNWSLIHQFAVSQGRIWAYVSGTLIYLALYFQGSIAGEAIRVGSFAAFFVLFYVVASIYFGRRLALMAALLNLSLFALRWEGSIVSTYPAFAWILSSLFLFSVWLGRHYASNERPYVLYAGLTMFFVSLFLHEGMSILFAGLYILSVFANQYLIKREFPLLVAVLKAPESRQHLIGAVASIVLYFGLYMVWRLIFPTNYEGNSLGDGSISRVMPTWIGLSTSGSLLADIVKPYTVNFADAVGKDGYQISYHVFSFLGSVTEDPSAMVSGLIVFSSVYSITNFVEQAEQGKRTRKLAIWSAVVGGLIAFVPILPVALVAKYQRHYFELGVHSYVYTALSHFGITLGIAGLFLWAVSAIPRSTSFRNVIAGIIGIAIALLAVCGYKMNNAIANDIRGETTRWKVVDQTLEIVGHLKPPINIIYAPRLFSGTWFTVLDANYWAQYVLARHGKVLAFTRDPIPIPSATNSTAYMDYNFVRNDSQLTTIVAPLRGPNELGLVTADKIAVAIDRPDPSDISRYAVSFRNSQSAPVEMRFSQLSPLNSSGTIRYASNIDALPASLRLNRNSTLATLAVLCGKSIGKGATIFFGTDMPDTGFGCIASDELRNGWNARERRGVWSKDDSALIDIPTSGLVQGALLLTLSVGTYTGLGFYDVPQVVSVRKNKHILATRLDRKGVGIQPLEIRIASSDWRQGEKISLWLHTDRTINPAKEKLSGDARDLGIHIQSIKIAVTN